MAKQCPSKVKFCFLRTFSATITKEKPLLNQKIDMENSGSISTKERDLETINSVVNRFLIVDVINRNKNEYSRTL